MEGFLLFINHGVNFLSCLQRLVLRCRKGRGGRFRVMIGPGNDILIDGVLHNV